MQIENTMKDVIDRRLFEKKIVLKYLVKMGKITAEQLNEDLFISEVRLDMRGKFVLVHKALFDEEKLEYNGKFENEMTLRVFENQYTHSVVVGNNKLVGAGEFDGVHNYDWMSFSCIERFGYDRPEDEDTAKTLLGEIGAKIDEWVKEFAKEYWEKNADTK